MKGKMSLIRMNLLTKAETYNLRNMAVVFENTQIRDHHGRIQAFLYMNAERNTYIRLILTWSRSLCTINAEIFRVSPCSKNIEQ